MLTLLLAAAARAACAVEQHSSAEGMDVVIRALAEPVGCRTVALTSDRPLDVEIALWSPEGRRTRLDDAHRRRLPGGGWEIGAPELEPGGQLFVRVAVPGNALEIRLAPAPAPTVNATRIDEVHTLTLDAKHPGWGFADRARARTRVVATYAFPPDAPAQILPLPAGALDVVTGGLARVPDGVAVPAGAASATVSWTLAGAAPQGVRALTPGSLTLLAPGVRFETSGVPSTPVDGGVRFDAPSGGEARWRVVSAGADPVIPDVDTFVAGLDWRFARVSLPEPAVPVELRGKRDRAELFDALLAATAALRDGALPGTDPLQPRSLNAAWRSGWATPVERGLVLQRLLGQEKFRAAWVLTGARADAATLTGFDHLLLHVAVAGAARWIDPSCAVCAPGEVGTAWFGKPAVGLDLGPIAADGEESARSAAAPWGILPSGATVPRAEGRLDRRLAIVGERFRVSWTAEGAAALWLRERLVGVDPAVRGHRLAQALGLPDGTLLEATGFEDAGEPITVVLEGARPPEDPFPTPDATPWAGGWGDAL